MSAVNSTSLRGPVYGRMSSDEQEDSIRQQLDWALPACVDEGITITGTFTDEGLSGHDDQREGLLALIAHCEQLQRAGNPANVIVAWHHNRIGRADSLRSGHHLLRLRDAGVRWIFTATRWYDLHETGDLTILTVEQNHSNLKYSVDLAHASTRGKVKNAKSGGWNGGRVPYGYTLTLKQNDKGRFVPDTLVPDPVTRGVVSWLFETYADGKHSLRMLVEALNVKREPTPSARGGWPNPAPLWSVSSVRNILSSEMYLGSMAWNRTHRGRFVGVVDLKPTAMEAKPVKRRGTGGRKQGKSKRKNATSVTRNDPEQHLRAAKTHDALTTPELFSKCQIRLVEQRDNKTPIRGGGDLTLSGLIRCGHCGQLMQGKMSIGRRVFVCGTYARFGKSYCHQNLIRQDELQRGILAKLQSRLSADAVAQARHLLEAEVGYDLGVAELDRLRGRVVELDRLISRAARRMLTIDDDMVAKAFQDEVKVLQVERDELAAEVLVKDRASAERIAPDLIIDRAVQVMTALASAADSATPAELRAILSDHVEKVELWFTHTPKVKKTLCAFVRGLIWVREDSPLSTLLSMSPGRSEQESKALELLPADLAGADRR